MNGTMDKMYSSRKRNSSIKKLFTSTFGPRNYSEESEAEIFERELAKEDKPPPDRKLARIRIRGANVLHSKQVLLAVVLLNLIDCVLVLGELMLDIHYIKDIIKTSEVAAQGFINKMESRYPETLHDNSVDQLEKFYDKIFLANCSWDGFENFNNDSGSFSQELNSRVRRDTDAVFLDQSTSSHGTAHEQNLWEEIAHALHKASIAILGILFVENILKIIFMGKAFFRRKLEVFDALIVLVSFVLDLVFLKGLTVYRIQDGILLLSFLLPWRVIRVVNSLIVAVLDHEHFRLKMMYKKQKIMALELKALKDKAKQFDFHLKRIERFCLSEGIPEWKVKQHTTFFREQSTVSSMASYALGGMLDGLMGQLGKSNMAFSQSWENNSSKVFGGADTSSLCSDSNSVVFDRGSVDKPSPLSIDRQSGCQTGQNGNSQRCSQQNFSLNTYCGSKTRKCIETGNDVFDSGRSSVSDVDFSAESSEASGSANIDDITCDAQTQDIVIEMDEAVKKEGDMGNSDETLVVDIEGKTNEASVVSEDEIDSSSVTEYENCESGSNTPTYINSTKL